MIDDFYIGYDTPVPRQSRRVVFGLVTLALSLAVALAVMLVVNQQPFANAVFAFGQREVFTGVVRIDPDPALEVSGERILLAGPGKHGAAGLVRAFEGRPVRLEGAPIMRLGRRMVEIVPASVSPIAMAMPAAPEHTVASLGEMTLAGEIVDAKCFLGVMNPGEGTVHRDCAKACLRGGLPPLFVVRTADDLVMFTLAAPDGGDMSEAVAPWAGRPVSITGRVERRGSDNRWVLTADPRSIRAR